MNSTSASVEEYEFALVFLMWEEDWKQGVTVAIHELLWSTLEQRNSTQNFSVRSFFFDLAQSKQYSIVGPK